MSSPNRQIIVKFVAKGKRFDAVWRRQLPASGPVWGNCYFVFDPDERRYDWLVVYDDLPPLEKDGRLITRRTEQLACPREHTLLITAEPSSVKIYGSRFLAQFGTVLSSQEPQATPHPSVIHSQPALRWYYGLPHSREYDRLTDFDTLCAQQPMQKQKDLSTVCSNKQMAHTMHRSRYNFIQRISKELPDMDVFGLGVRPINDKAMALDPYRYHIAIENHIAPHHWTEKLADVYLGYTLPIYCGCPNLGDYFPEESYIAIDIGNFDQSLQTIRDAIENREYEKRLPAISEARNRVLHKYNIFAVIADIASQRHNPAAIMDKGAVISSRHALHRTPIGGIKYLIEQFRLSQLRKANS